ncbi:hypothetical protein TRAPUB_1125 [Trametes pubescens]|uniref:Calcineurin-like phosphoesterase domain-containing protein n=1 Tax=Trametes pubescens TaxID=154538 RepID=A0A1M2VK47_TRAPU|nr:hypothetical protein TRAPUB_1125 [Trametes pubescens]
MDGARRNPEDPVIRVVCISDTHNAHDRLPPLPKGDILIHAGDLTNTGTELEVRKAVHWLDRAPHRYKVFIAGNHDTALANPVTRAAILADYPDVIYLEDNSVMLEPVAGRLVTLYGTPRTPRRGPRGRGVFQYWHREERWMRAIPTRTDILVTHGPPQHHRDVAGLGCNRLRYELWRVRPRLHVFGHVHAGRGVERATWLPVQDMYEALCRRREGYGWRAVLKIVFAALLRVVAPTHDTHFRRTGYRGESLLVNASSMTGWARDADMQEPIVVELALPALMEKARQSNSRMRNFQRKGNLYSPKESWMPQLSSSASALSAQHSRDIELRATSINTE